MKKVLKFFSVGAMAIVSASTLFVTRTFAAPLDWLEDMLHLSGPDVTLGDLIVKLINWAIGFSAVIAVVMIIVAGFQYITASGDENKIGKATKTLTFAIVGLVVCFIAVLLVNFVLTNFLTGTTGGGGGGGINPPFQME